MTKDKKAYEICSGINGNCWCASRGLPPCMAIVEMLENGVDAKEELARIKNNIDHGWFIGSRSNQPA